MERSSAASAKRTRTELMTLMTVRGEIGVPSRFEAWVRSSYAHWRRAAVPSSFAIARSRTAPKSGRKWWRRRESSSCQPVGSFCFRSGSQVESKYSVIVGPVASMARSAAMASPVAAGTSCGAGSGITGATASTAFSTTPPARNCCSNA
jgi:hypothetical protein